MIKGFLKKFGLATLTTLVVILSITSFYFYKKSNIVDPVITSQKAVEDVTKKVNKLIVLPTGETPTLATVTDLEALKGQLFFADAQIGDKVLMYTTAKKAILYNPSIDKVVNIAPIDIGGVVNNQTSSSKNFTEITNTKNKK